MKSFHQMEKNPNWKGGRRMRTVYVYLRRPEHPDADAMGYVAEHRLKIEKKIGRRLKKNEVVHHKNQKTLDNRLSNLQLMTRSEHIAHHNRTTKVYPKKKGL